MGESFARLMHWSSKHPILSFVIGGIVFVLLNILFLMTPAAVKSVGGLLMMLPEALGVAEIVTIDEVFALPDVNDGHLVDIQTPGYYAIYTNDTQVLSRLELFLLGDSNFLLAIHHMGRMTKGEKQKSWKSTSRYQV